MDETETFRFRQKLPSLVLRLVLSLIISEIINNRNSLLVHQHYTRVSPLSDNTIFTSCAVDQLNLLSKIPIHMWLEWPPRMYPKHIPAVVHSPVTGLGYYFLTLEIYPPPTLHESTGRVEQWQYPATRPGNERKRSILLITSSFQHGPTIFNVLNPPALVLSAPLFLYLILIIFLIFCGFQTGGSVYCQRTTKWTRICEHGNLEVCSCYMNKLAHHLRKTFVSHVFPLCSFFYICPT